ncbi:MAG: VOC family protein [Pigmentiphaga sp.]
MRRFTWAGFRTLVRVPAPTAPGGMATITPHLVCDGAATAIEFYVKALGARELARLPAPDGRLLHAMVQVGDSTVMLCDPFEGCDDGPVAPSAASTLHVYVADVDAALARAVEAGATQLMPATDMFWGDRYARFRDPFGHCWALAAPVREVSNDEIREEAAKLFAGGA